MHPFLRIASETTSGLAAREGVWTKASPRKAKTRVDQNDFICLFCFVVKNCDNHEGADTPECLEMNHKNAIKGIKEQSFLLMIELKEIKRIPSFIDF